MKASAHSLSSSPRFRAHLRRLPIVMMLTLASHGQADADADAKLWQVHGFLAQAAFHTSDNNVAGDSDDGLSTDYNEAGFSASLSLPFKARMSGQVLARNAGNYDNGELRTDYFNLDLQLFSSAAIRAGTRIGRVRNAYGLYNETRDVAHTRPGITLPGVIYLEQARDLNISRDGFGVYADIFDTCGTLSIEAGAGRARVSNRLVKEALMSEATGVEPEDARIMMLAVSWEDADGHWRFAGSTHRITSDVEVSLESVFPGSNLQFDGDFQLDDWILSAQYSTEQWQLTTEWLHFDYDLGFDFVSRRYPGDGIYVQYNWLFSPAWQLYGRYEYGVLDRHHRNGSSMEQFCGTVFDDYCNQRHSGFRRASIIGLRWDINTQWMVATEAHYVEGTMGLPYSDNRDMLDTTPYWTLLAIELAFRF